MFSYPKKVFMKPYMDISSVPMLPPQKIDFSNIVVVKYHGYSYDISCVMKSNVDISNVSFMKSNVDVSNVSCVMKSKKSAISDISSVFICDLSSIWISSLDISNSNSNTDISFVNIVLEEIAEYANKIYSDVYGIDEIEIITKEDYTKLFLVAAKIAKQAKEVTLSIDYSIFGDFANVADNLHDVFQNYIFQMKSMNDINDVELLKSICSSLKKICNIKETFRKFKEAIMSLSLDTIMYNEIQDMSMNEIEIIESSIEKIQNWNKLYTTGMKIELSDKSEKFEQSVNKIMRSTTEILEDAASVFTDKDKKKNSNKKK